MSKGLRKAIEDKMPQHWDEILRKHKAYSIFIELVYRSLPNDVKGHKITCGRMAWKKGVMRINFLFNNYQMIKCFNMDLLHVIKPKQPINWQQIQIEINERENLWN